jgi:hypothetical protein
MKTYEQIKEFLESLLIDKNIVDSIDINMIDQNNPFDSIFNYLSSINGFHKKFVNSKEAMDYLTRYDTSLVTSLNLIGGYGLGVYDINAITLATVLSNERGINSLYEVKDQIEDFFRVNNYFEN